MVIESIAATDARGTGDDAAPGRGPPPRAVAEPPAIALRNVESSDGPQVYRDTAVRISPAALDLLEAGDLQQLLGSLRVDADEVAAPVAALV